LGTTRPVLGWEGERCLGPVVIEADADALGVDAVGGDLVAEPAFEEDDVAGFGGVGDVRAVGGFGVGEARRGGHEFAEARVFEFKAGAAGRGGDVVGAADEGERVKVERMCGGRRHDVHPAIGHVDGAAAEIEFEGAGEGADVAGDLFFEIGEGAGEAMELVEGRVGGVAARVVFLAPFAAGDVEVAELAAFVGEGVVEAGEAGALERFAVDVGGKPGASGHARERSMRGGRRAMRDRRLAVMKKRRGRKPRLRVAA
jgi:hypothetical protein